MRLSRIFPFQLLSLSFLAVSLGLTAFAEGDALTPYEQSFFSHSYMDESLHDRLGRLEQSVFGDIQQGTDTERQARLMNALKSVPTAAWKPESDEAQPEGPSDNTPADETAAEKPAPQPKDATDYPTVTALERTVFGRDFVQDDVTVRLTRLEKHTLGTDSPDMALVDRVDRLLARYPEAKAGVIPRRRVETTTNPVLKQLPDDPRQFASSTSDVYTKVEALERRFFNQSSNARVMLTERLDQLEQRAYGRTYSGESIDTRVNRLMSQFMVAKASSQLNSRLTHQQPQVIYDGSNAVPQNVQIGTGFSQNSQIRFSQDLMNMLPDDVKSQLQNQTGTVVVEQSKTTGTYPGFQTYSGQPIQYYNYYGMPGGTQVQSQTTTTVIQPNGGTVVYGYNTPGAMQNPAYVGDPAFLQQLNSVEANVFGRVDTMLPVQNRLQNLEMAMLGKTQPNLPESERLHTVFRAWKIKQISQIIGPGDAKPLGIPLNQPGK
jgi:hypothetical protein